MNLTASTSSDWSSPSALSSAPYSTRTPPLAQVAPGACALIFAIALTPCGPEGPVGPVSPQACNNKNGASTPPSAPP
jgi:hypothetical protein